MAHELLYPESHQSAETSASAGMLAGRYVVGELIGEGSFAETFVATDVMLNRRVAIKILRPELSAHPEYVERFAREAQAAAAVRHSNVIDVFDFGKDGNWTFLVMEWVSGPSLKRFINQRRLNISQALAITGEVLNGLAAIHAAGIVHRDIKPHNILLSSGTPKVTDFGIARFNGAASTTRPGVAIGTASYMAPEQARGESSSPTVDIYAMGVLLFEMVTGRLPFPGNDPIQVLYQHVHEHPPRPRLLNAGIPPQVENIILRAMSKNPEDRYQSAEEMFEATDLALMSVDEQPTTVITSPALSEPSAGLLSRGIHRTAPLAAIAAFIAILIATAGIALAFGGAPSSDVPTTEPGIAEAPFETLDHQLGDFDPQEGEEVLPADTEPVMPEESGIAELLSTDTEPVALEESGIAEPLPADTEPVEPEESDNEEPLPADTEPVEPEESGHEEPLPADAEPVEPEESGNEEPDSNEQPVASEGDESATSQVEPPASPSGGEQVQVQDTGEGNGNGNAHGQQGNAPGHQNASPQDGVPPGKDRNSAGNRSSLGNSAAAPRDGNSQGTNRGGRGR